MIVKIFVFLLGAAFLLFGYFIYFQKKYTLINGFEAAFKAGLKDETYARRVGLTEWIIGIVLLVIGILLVILT